MRPIDANKFLVSANYVGNWEAEKLPPLKATISEEIRDKHFISPYRLDMDELLNYRSPLAEAVDKWNKKEKERITMYEKVKVLFDGHSYYPSDVRISARPGETTVMEIECPIGYTPYHTVTPKKPEPKFPGIKKVVYNPPATIVFWEDDTKTVVQCRENDSFDPEKGLAMAITKKALGNKHEYYNVVKKWLKKAPKPKLLDMKLDELQTFEFKAAGADINTALLGDLLGTTKNGLKVYMKNQTEDGLIVKAKKEDSDEPATENGEV